MISYLDGQTLLSKLASNIRTNVSFYVPMLLEGSVSYAYKTPLYQAVEIETMNITAKSQTSSVTNISLDIVSPLGNKSSYSLLNLALKADEETSFDIPVKYKPSEIGVYTVTFTSSQDPKHSLIKKFEITNKTFGLDNDNLSKAITIYPDDYSFKKSNYIYSIGAIYYFPKEVKDKGITVSFGLQNSDIYIGESLEIYLYKEPMGGFDSGLGNYDNLDVVGFQSHTITANDQSLGGLIDVKLFDVNTFEEKITLQANKHYFAVVKYEGKGNIETAPRFLHSPKDLFLSYSTTVYTDQLYMWGWDSGQQAVLRLSIEDSSLGLNNQKSDIDAHQIYPNPTTGLVQISKDKEWELYTLDGKKINQGQGNVIDLSKEDHGVYLLKFDHEIHRISKIE